MRARILASLILLAALHGASALAADMSYKAPVYKTAYKPMPFTWAGWYVGINGGYGWGDPTANITPANVPIPATAFLNAAAGSFDLSNSPKGGFIGGQIGYNWQFGNLVAGLEADFDYAWMSDSASGGFTNIVTFFADPGRTVGTAKLDSRMDWFATFRGRFGYAFDRLLPYVTAGVAVAHMKSTVAVSGTHIDIGGLVVGGFSNSVTVSNTNWGLALGGGLDWAITDRWVLRGEYLYMRFPDKNHGALIPGVTAINNSMNVVNIARVALNYRFTP
jgi:outer membrane immunogenic protein